MTPLYRALATKVAARINCQKAGNTEWLHRHREEGDRLVRDLMPSGGGFDNGTTLDWEKSTHEKLVFLTAFHHMDEHGCYAGWTSHTVTVRGSLMYGSVLTISGPNRNTIKDYIHEVFDQALNQRAPSPVAVPA
jgi:hypothetical protein